MSLFDQLYDVAHCAINDVTPETVADGTAAAVITDPPYPRKCLPLFSSLSRFAERVLKPGGWCVAMSGNAFLPDVLNRLGEHLKYRWAFAVVCPGGRTNRNWGLCLFQAYKPVLIYQKPPVALDHDFTPDVIVSLPREYNSPATRGSRARACSHVSSSASPSLATWSWTRLPGAVPQGAPPQAGAQ